MPAYQIICVFCHPPLIEYQWIKLTFTFSLNIFRIFSISWCPISGVVLLIIWPSDTGLMWFTGVKSNFNANKQNNELDLARGGCYTLLGAGGMHLNSLANWVSTSYCILISDVSSLYPDKILFNAIQCVWFP